MLNSFPPYQQYCCTIIRLDITKEYNNLFLAVLFIRDSEGAKISNINSGLGWDGGKFKILISLLK